jgi:hypothetical protein
MDWIRAHPYTAALGAAVILFIGGFFVVQRQGAAPPSENKAWDGANLGVLNPTSYGPAESAGTSREEDIMQQVQDSAPYTYIPPTVLDGSEGGAEGDFDLNSFIKMLGQGSTSTGQSQSSAPDTFSFIPTGLISTTTVQKARTATQETLYNYGNEVGSYIQSFEEQNPTMSFTLKDHAEDRDDPQKAAAVKLVAKALEEVGHSLLGIEDIPSGIASTHNALAKSYIAVGTNLALVAQTANDADFLKAIETYNATANTFVTNYVGLAELLGAYNIVFSPVDAGSVFTFTPTGL